jgi:excisionase family DNA binding protein
VSRKARDTRRAVRPPADADALLSPEQVARRCGLSRRAVYRAVERGKLRASRLCSGIRLHAWLPEEELPVTARVSRGGL